MKFKYLFIIIIALAFVGAMHAETFMPTNGTFAYQEVEIFEINGINFTVPTDYNVTYQNHTEMDFKNAQNKLKISVVEKGTIKKVKANAAKNITSGKTFLGPVKGYMVDKNGKYTFSYKEDGKLVTLKSKDMQLIIGAMGKE